MNILDAIKQMDDQDDEDTSASLELYQDDIFISVKKGFLISSEQVVVQLSKPDEFVCFKNARYTLKYLCEDKCMDKHELKCKLDDNNHACLSFTIKSIK